MGAFAETVRDSIRDSLAKRLPRFEWETEYRIQRTPVDVVGHTDDRFVAVELEWRRADPVNNTAKLFYYVNEGELAEYDRISVVQVFTDYYALASGGVSSKREVAEFVGTVTANSFEQVSFSPVTFGLTPPKRGGEWPDEWEGVAEETVEEIVRRI
ncbi:hypothetical protein A4G99_00825 [Haladaptatus sp. R4]|uniref:hypothetical protein n=1 Tax=Haladaptatus sp. R4 TaxID=1679489 RepID=UPI0007B4B222|nr:hypothetical protein [Haladaptatus sp. R4]KZN25110.1 hypothetical protein A4G99_00825 [Haladaptatus sp. R4]